MWTTSTVTAITPDDGWRLRPHQQRTVEALICMAWAHLPVLGFWGIQNNSICSWWADKLILNLYVHNKPFIVRFTHRREWESGLTRQILSTIRCWHWGI
jgi:hypothetical protein